MLKTFGYFGLFVFVEKLSANSAYSCSSKTFGGFVVTHLQSFQDFQFPLRMMLTINVTSAMLYWPSPLTSEFMKTITVLLSRM